MSPTVSRSRFGAHARRPLAVLAAGLSVALVTGALGAPAQSKPARPDLKVVRVSNPPAQATGGQLVESTVRVRNVGKKSTFTSVTTYLSKTQTASPGEVEQLSKLVRNVGPRSRTDVTIRNRVPQSLVPEAGAPPADSTYYVVACVPRRGETGNPRCAVSGEPMEILPFAAGARTLDDPLFPQTGNGGYDASHYDIDLSFQPGNAPEEQLFLEGTTTTITATATQGLSELSLDFQPFDVSSVRVNGEEAGFAYADTAVLGDPEVVTQLKKLVITPEEPIGLGEEFTVEVDYTGTPEKMVDVDESFEGWIPACYTVSAVTTCDGAFVVNEPNGAQTFFPSNNYPTDKATFDTTITVPTGKTALGIGELVEPPVDNGDGTTTWSWTEDEPTSTYLTTASVGDFGVEEGTVRELTTGRDLPFTYAIDSSATPTQVNNINNSLRRTRGMINFLSDKFGPYPLDSTGAVVDRTTGVGYALEVQTKPHYATLSVSVTTHLHELAHQWFGNNATLAQWTDIWFNEGWAQWATWSWNHEENGNATSPAQQFINNYTPGTKWEVAPATLDGDPGNLFSTFPTYTRGAMTLEGYRQIVGDDVFYPFAQGLQTEFATGNISTTEFIDYALDASGLEGADLERLEDYFQEWLYGEVQPTITPANFYPPADPR